MSAMKGMFSFFTMIRLDIDEKDMDDMNRRFWLAPVIGVFYGLISAGLLYVLSQVLPMIVSAVLTLFVIQGMNRFLHVDGTIDVGDGLVVAGTREDHLRALKDTRIGAGGMAFALFVVMLSVAAMSSIGAEFIIFIPFMAEVLAKNSMVAAAAFGLPGEGMAGESIRNTTGMSVAISTTISVIAMILFIMIAGIWFDLGNNILLFIAIAVMVSILTGALMSRIAHRNFGIVNGDVLGATNEISRAVTMIVMLALMTVV